MTTVPVGKRHEQDRGPEIVIPEPGQVRLLDAARTFLKPARQKRRRRQIFMEFLFLFRPLAGEVTGFHFGDCGYLRNRPNI